MFSKNLKRIMKEKGFTLTRLAMAGGFSKGAVSAWLNGQYEPPPKKMAAIAAVLGVEAGDLARGPEPQGAASPRNTMTVQEVARLLHKRERNIRDALQQNRVAFGHAVKTSSSNKWDYCIYARKFTEITGIPVD